MKTASAYTNHRRVKAEATNLKVEYPGSIAKNYAPIQAATGCPLKIYDQITYVNVARCTYGLPVKNKLEFC
jgi:hypothetical protein